MTEQAYPEYTETAELGNKGRRIVEHHIHEEFGWLFREIAKDDLGIDGIVEVIEENCREARGRAFAVQIKCGHSFFKEESETGYVYRGSMKHLNYWLGYPMPVVLILCNPDTRACYWVEISSGSIELHEKGWSIVVLKSKALSLSSKHELRWLVRRPLAEDITEVGLYRLLSEKYENISIAPVCATPHDFIYFDELAEIDGETYLVACVYKPAENFLPSDVEEIIEKAKICAKACGWTHFNKSYRVLIVFVAHSVERLTLSSEVKAEVAKHQNLETLRAVCTVGIGAGLTEIDENGQYVLVI